MHRLAFLALLPAAAACASGGAAPSADKAPRLLSANAPVTCAEWVARAQASPELDVDRVPAPVAYDPAPIPRRLPPGGG